MADDGTVAAPPLLNVNVGVMGHVDSGKTNLVRALSTQLSTAALDKNPQSQQRGITLDLGFSAFVLPPATATAATADSTHEPQIQITLVDCPGHASLFKTILGGARIIDMVLLVVDVQKGLQPQTIECLVVAELAVAHHVLIALNKVDLIPERFREQRVHKITSDIRAFLSRHFACFRDRSVAIVPVAAAPASVAAPVADDTVESGSPLSTAAPSVSQSPLGISELMATLRSHLYVPERDASGPFSLAIDHCFAIQGNGTILTGTVLSGSVCVGDEIEIPSLQVVKRVKSMQMFKKSVSVAAQGDRVGIRVNALDASLVERGMAITPHSMVFVSQAVVPVRQITFFQGGNCKTGGRFHATIGHTTVVAVATFFSRMSSDPTLAAGGDGDATVAFDPTCLYEHVAHIDAISSNADDEQASTGDARAKTSFYALLQFDQPILCQPGALVVCSRLDLDPKRFACRLAFHGRVQAIVTTSSSSPPQDVATSDSSKPLIVSLADLRIGKVKSREGVVDKVVTASSDPQQTRGVLGRDMFSKDVDWSVYANATVLFESSRVLGKILAPFGKAGKFRIELLDPVSAGSRQLPAAGEKIVLRFVKLVVLKPPVLKGKGHGGATKATGGGGSSSASNRAKASGNLLQDDKLLYPEAFEPRDVLSASEVPALADVIVDSSQVAASDEPSVVQCTGHIERLKGETTPDGRNPIAIVSGLFSSDQEASTAIGQQVVVVSSPSKSLVGERGAIEKPFGKAGKVRVAFTENGGTLAQPGDKVRLSIMH